MRVCIFCGSEGLTREHIYPEWIFNFIGGVEKEHFTPNKTSMAVSRTDDNDDYYLAVEQQNRKIPYTDFAVKCVCGKCNNGWMSQLENDMIPLFRKFRYNELDIEDLNVDEAFILARWAIVRIIIVSQVHADQLFFDEGLLDEVKQGKIPNGFRVELLTTEKLNLSYLLNGYPEPVAVNCSKQELLTNASGFFLAGFQVGHLMFRVSFLNEDNIFRIFLNQMPFTLFPFNENLPLVTGTLRRQLTLEQKHKGELDMFCSNIIISDVLPQT